MVPFKFIHIPVEFDGSGALRRGGYGSHAAEHANDVTVDERSANTEADRCNGAWDTTRKSSSLCDHYTVVGRGYILQQRRRYSLTCGVRADARNLEKFFDRVREPAVVILCKRAQNCDSMIAQWTARHKLTDDLFCSFVKHSPASVVAEARPQAIDFLNKRQRSQSFNGCSSSTQNRHTLRSGPDYSVRTRWLRASPLARMVRTIFDDNTLQLSSHVLWRWLQASEQTSLQEVTTSRKKRSHDAMRYVTLQRVAFGWRISKNLGLWAVCPIMSSFEKNRWKRKAIKNTQDSTCTARVLHLYVLLGRRMVIVDVCYGHFNPRHQREQKKKSPSIFRCTIGKFLPAMSATADKTASATVAFGFFCNWIEGSLDTWIEKEALDLQRSRKDILCFGRQGGTIPHLFNSMLAKLYGIACPIRTAQVVSVPLHQIGTTREGSRGKQHFAKPKPMPEKMSRSSPPATPVINAANSVGHLLVKSFKGSVETPSPVEFCFVRPIPADEDLLHSSVVARKQHSSLVPPVSLSHFVVYHTSVRHKIWQHGVTLVRTPTMPQHNQ